MSPKSEFSLFEDYQRLRVLVAGLDLVAEWYLFISKREGSNKRGEIISFFENISDFSYWKEARFHETFWKSLLSSSFEFVGYRDGSDWEKNSNKVMWGLSTNEKKIRLLKDGEALMYSPILELSLDLSKLLEDSTVFAGMSGINDKTYILVKDNLPYPFREFSKKNE